ncbi:MAG: hypothetical protein K2Q14_00965 [Gammaproteobacteria bacterium]|nr:hypothetical protein [Gammaproteobacteria bacterium]
MLKNDLIRPILQVLQYSFPPPTIIIDTIHGDIRYISCSGTERGVFNRPTHRVYVGAGDDHEDMYGTLVHELTHFACKVVYGNNSFPYRPASDDEKEMNKIVSRLYDRRGNKEFKYRVNALKFFRAMFDSYDDMNQMIKESIVRVPQTLFVYKQEGLTALQEHTKKLWVYYKDKFLLACKEFVEKKNRFEEISVTWPDLGSTATFQHEATSANSSSSFSNSREPSPSSLFASGSGPAFFSTSFQSQSSPSSSSRTQDNGDKEKEEITSKTKAQSQDKIRPSSPPGAGHAGIRA